jgi:hypothetical protein
MVTTQPKPRKETQIKVPQVPALRDDAGYAQAQAKLTELQLRLTSVGEEISHLLGQLAEAERSRKNPVVEAAERLLAGDDTSLDTVVQHGLNDRLSTLYRRRRILEEAISQQKRILEEERSRASREICESLRPEYLAVVQDLAEAIVAVGRAQEKYQSFVGTLDGADITWLSSLRPMSFHAASPREYNGRVGHWLLEALEYGLIDPSIIPAEWRQRWAR